MSFWAMCVQNGCHKSFKPEWTTYKEMFSHYYYKGREVLIELTKKSGVSIHPYSEPTYILADKMVKYSKINSSGVTN